jgi:hypothetical protein
LGSSLCSYSSRRGETCCGRAGAERRAADVGPCACCGSGALCSCRRRAGDCGASTSAGGHSRSVLQCSPVGAVPYRGAIRAELRPPPVETGCSKRCHGSSCFSKQRRSGESLLTRELPAVLLASKHAWHARSLQQKGSERQRADQAISNFRTADARAAGNSACKSQRMSWPCASQVMPCSGPPSGSINVCESAKRTDRRRALDRRSAPRAGTSHERGCAQLCWPGCAASR